MEILFKKPELGDTYWDVYEDSPGLFKTRRHVWENHPFDIECLNTGNYFSNKRLAIHAMWIQKQIYQNQNELQAEANSLVWP